MRVPSLLVIAALVGCGDATDPAATPSDSDTAEVDPDASSDGSPSDSPPADVGDGSKAPTIDSFVATPAAVSPGTTSKLTWAVTGGGTLTLDGAPVTGTSLDVTPAATTKYTLVATNGAGSATATATVTVTASTVPTKPITFSKNKPFTVDSGTVNYVYVPDAYDGSHKTPITLLVWLHGCGGFSSGDVWTVSPGGATQTWITLAVGGQEGKCWDVNKDPARVLAALADLKTHFNIKAKGTIVGGYSSGGDLSYRTAFYNANLFAGVLATNTSPFRDTGSTQAASLATAAWKFNVVHLAHLQDTTYPIAGVRKETDAMTAAGFPTKRIEVVGTHYDDAGAVVGGTKVPGTGADIATYLFPYLSSGWTSP